MKIELPVKAQSHRNAHLTDKKLHTQYRNAQGVRIPGVSTILKNLGWANDGLLNWQKNLLLSGADPDATLEEAATLGTVAHQHLEDWTNHRPTDTRHMKPLHVVYAQSVLQTFATWVNTVHFFILETEQQVISEAHQYGGTFDGLAQYQGKRTLYDHKTSKAIYPSHRIQLAAYALAYNEQHPDTPIEQLMVVKLGNATDFATHVLTAEEWEAATETFLCLRRLHELKKVFE